MKNIINTLMLLLFATAVLSCSVNMAYDRDPAPELPESDYAGFQIMVTGTVADRDSSPATPLEEIRITLKATENSNDGQPKVSTKTAYTDNKGKFTINMSGFLNPTAFTVTAEDMKGIYETGTHNIPLVTWENNYNMYGATFFVNGCDFHLKKVR